MIPSASEIEERITNAACSHTGAWLVGSDDEGTIVAQSKVVIPQDPTRQRMAFFVGKVHPLLRGKGLGKAIIDAEISYCHHFAREFPVNPGVNPDIRLEVSRHITNKPLEKLLVRQGFSSQRFYSTMSIQLTSSPQRYPLRENWEIRTLQHVDMNKSLALRNTVFSDFWGSPRVSYESWRSLLWNSPESSADFSLAVCEKTSLDPLAFCLCSVRHHADGSAYGHIDYLGVREDMRHQGLAHVLMGEVHQRMLHHGITTSTLTVDVNNVFGAAGLYRSLGYRGDVDTAVHTGTLRVHDH